jgi:hypothetical protein
VSLFDPNSTTSDLIHAHFFFVDIVGLSDPSTSTKTQKKKIQVLTECVSHSKYFESTPNEFKLILPTGDGMCIAFLQGVHLPLLLAIDLHKKLAEHNKGKIPTEIVKVRIGLNSGNCFVVKNISGEITPWGPGIILARRVMDLGDDGHILLTPRLADDLRELSDEYRKMIHPAQDFKIKHGQTLLVHSAYGDNFGNPTNPTKDAVEGSKYSEEVIRLQKTALYPSLDVSLTILDPKNMIVQHKRTYEIENISKEPIYHVLHGIGTDVEKNSIDDLKIQVYDEQKREMKISGINVNKPTCKEFTTEFNSPIVKDEKNRKYTLIYAVEEPERYFENAFLIDLLKFSLTFKYPAIDCECNPIIYEINQETEQKTKSKNQPTIEREGDHFIFRFVRENNMKGDTIRIEW